LIQDRGLSEIDTVADHFYENIRDRIHETFPCKKSLGRSKEGEKNNVPIEDETGHAHWGSRRSPSRSPDLSDDEESEDDHHTTEKPMRRSRTRSFDEQRPRRLRVWDWDADSPPQVQNRSRWHGDRYLRPYRGRLQALQYGPAYRRTSHELYGPIYDPPPGRAMYRCRSLTPPPRHGSRSDPNRHKREKIKATTKPFIAGAAGFIAGGFLGHAIGKGNTMATVAGAVIGAVGGTEAEQEWERHKERKEKDKERMRN